jgi:ATP-dependent helicase HepA
MFCVVKGLERLGVGKIVENTGNSWSVEYFDSPLNIIHETYQVAMSRVTSKLLGKNTRIYFQHPETSRWIVGRVLQDNEDGVEVRFTDKRDVFLGYDKIFVRCKKPISDPTDYLANFITETPQFSQARSNFLDSYKHRYF